jgi:hypothetical protein
MKLQLAALALAAAAIAAPAAEARDDIQTYSLDLVRAHPDYAEKVGDFRFEFGDKIQGQVIATTSAKRATNGINKKDQDACVWAMLSAMIALRNDALESNATSVQGIKSIVSGSVFSSSTEFQCKSGFTNSQVSLQGSLVK